MAHTVQNRAAEARAFFIFQKKRGATSDDNEIWMLKDKAPHWITQLVRDAHADYAPDDYRYEYIVDALELLSESEDPDEAREALEADIYTSDLTEWLASNISRVGYLSEVLEEFPDTDDGFDLLSRAQYQERSEIFDSVLDSLENNP